MAGLPRTHRPARHSTQGPVNGLVSDSSLNGEILALQFVDLYYLMKVKENNPHGFRLF